ncbi:MAG: FAD binding domain-containing protein [Planctomycetaceae bacterium]
MNPFEYAHPETEAEAVEFLNAHNGNTALLAGGTDLISLMKQDVLTPDRVVDLKNVESLSGITAADGGVLIGALTTLEELREHPLTAGYRSLHDVADGIRAIQVQANGTVGGDLCLLPNCWYFRSGYGLLAKENGKSLPEIGDNRFHAVLGNAGPAKYVSASRFAPAGVAWNARVRVVGPKPDREDWRPLDALFVTPKSERQGHLALKPGQFVSHLWLPAAVGFASATYEVLQSEGLDWPLAAAAVTLQTELGVVTQARIVLGHVAPVPWKADSAAAALRGRSVTPETAERIGEMAVADATPLSMNEYKVHLAKTAVKRALLRAADQPEGGL